MTTKAMISPRTPHSAHVQALGSPASSATPSASEPVPDLDLLLSPSPLRRISPSCSPSDSQELESEEGAARSSKNEHEQGSVSVSRRRSAGPGPKWSTAILLSPSPSPARGQGEEEGSPLRELGGDSATEEDEDIVMQDRKSPVQAQTNMRIQLPLVYRSPPILLRLNTTALPRPSFAGNPVGQARTPAQKSARSISYSASGTGIASIFAARSPLDDRHAAAAYHAQTPNYGHQRSYSSISSYAHDQNKNKGQDGDGEREREREGFYPTPISVSEAERERVRYWPRHPPPPAVAAQGSLYPSPAQREYNYNALHTIPASCRADGAPTHTHTHAPAYTSASVYAPSPHPPHLPVSPASAQAQAQAQAQGRMYPALLRPRLQIYPYAHPAARAVHGPHASLPAGSGPDLRYFSAGGMRPHSTSLAAMWDREREGEKEWRSPSSAISPGGYKAPRKRADDLQLHVLNQVFSRTSYPSTEERDALARRLGMTSRSVQIWFQNRRRAVKVEQQSAVQRAQAQAQVQLHGAHVRAGRQGCPSHLVFLRDGDEREGGRVGMELDEFEMLERVQMQRHRARDDEKSGSREEKEGGRSSPTGDLRLVETEREVELGGQEAKRERISMSRSVSMSVSPERRVLTDRPW